MPKGIFYGMRERENIIAFVYPKDEVHNLNYFKNIFERGEYNLQAIENGKLSALIVSYIPNGRDVFAENSKRFAMENNVNAIFGGCNFGTMSLEQIVENSFNKIKDDNFKD